MCSRSALREAWRERGSPALARMNGFHAHDRRPRREATNATPRGFAKHMRNAVGARARGLARSAVGSAKESHAHDRKLRPGDARATLYGAREYVARATRGPPPKKLSPDKTVSPPQKSLPGSCFFWGGAAAPPPKKASPPLKKVSPPPKKLRHPKASLVGIRARNRTRIALGIHRSVTRNKAVREAC